MASPAGAARALREAASGRRATAASQVAANYNQYTNRVGAVRCECNNTVEE